MDRPELEALLLRLGFERFNEPDSPEVKQPPAETYILNDSDTSRPRLVQIVPNIEEDLTYPVFWCVHDDALKCTIAILDFENSWIAYDLFNLTELGFTRMYEYQIIH